MKRLAGALIGVAAIVGMRFYAKASAHEDVRARLIELCSGDAQCQTAVQTNYDPCFETAYKLSERRDASKFDANTLVACVNRRSGEEYFTVNEAKK
jgi:hypothetical protein